MGEIPEGFHVHHVDGNTANNNPENLVAIHPEEHLQITVEGWKRRGGSWKDQEAMAEHLDKIRPLTKEWHGSEEGLRWHREHAYRSIVRGRLQPQNV